MSRKNKLIRSLFFYRDYISLTLPRANPLKRKSPNAKVNFLIRRHPSRDSVGIRTRDPQLRRLLLYPAELRNQKRLQNYSFFFEFPNYLAKITSAHRYRSVFSFAAHPIGSPCLERCPHHAESSPPFSWPAQDGCSPR